MGLGYMSEPDWMRYYSKERTSLAPETQWGKMGGQFWQEELAKMLGIQRGTTTPQELPEFRGMTAGLMSNINKQRNVAYQEGIKRGLTGGALEAYMKQFEEQTQTGPLSLIQNIYQQSLGRGGQAAQQGLGWEQYARNLRQAYDQMAQNWKRTQLEMKAKKMEQMQKNFWSGMSMLSSGIGGGFGGGGGGGGGAFGGSMGAMGSWNNPY